MQYPLTLSLLSLSVAVYDSHKSTFGTDTVQHCCKQLLSAFKLLQLARGLQRLASPADSHSMTFSNGEQYSGAMMWDQWLPWMPPISRGMTRFLEWATSLFWGDITGGARGDKVTISGDCGLFILRPSSSYKNSRFWNVMQRQMYTYLYVHWEITLDNSILMLFHLLCIFYIYNDLNTHICLYIYIHTHMLTHTCNLILKNVDEDFHLKYLEVVCFLIFQLVLNEDDYKSNNKW